MKKLKTKRPFKPLELDDYQSLINGARVKGKNIWLLTTFLRDHRFVFIPDSVIETLHIPLNIKDDHHDHAYMLIARIDKEGEIHYDQKLAFGVKLVGMLSKEVHIYLNGNFFETWVLPIGHKKENFRKTKAHVKFPKELTYDQRSDWRKEHIQLARKPDLKPSKFYETWLPHIQFLEKN